MKDIIPPIPIQDIENELKKATLLRKTNYGGNLVYLTTNNETPILLREIGRLRELTFRNAGGGTGKDCDLDKFDVSDTPYQQLFVWNPEDKEIIGGYRFYKCNNETDECLDLTRLATSNLFKFSDKFVHRYLPHLMELGRSFVVPSYQTRDGERKSLYALDNLWDGLGAFVINNPDIRFFFGKVTMYQHFNRDARDLILFFLNKHFGDHEGLLIPFNPLQLNLNSEKLESIFIGKSKKEDYKILSQEVRALGENIPPLINAYMNLSPTMKTFGTVINEGFGGVEETGIMITLKDMYVSKINRHLASYREDYELPSF
ncbi:MAG: GNAT family N-acetyltransferase [Bacteroidales bacterium]|nr:GNAT family N-acetyltransferase [Bacteroidales bacterium]